jgi:hypothetical protein
MPGPMDNFKGILIGDKFPYENEKIRYGKDQKCRIWAV